MNIEYLREFCIFAEFLSFTKAAEKLYVSQSTLSKHMAALEKEFGCTLVQRESGDVSLSASGSAILENALRVIREYEALRGQLEKLKSANPMLLKVMHFDTYRPMHDIIHTATLRINRENPVFDIKNLQLMDKSPIGEIRAGNADICYSELKPGVATDDLCVEWLYDEPLAAVVNKNHPLANQKTISVKKLEGHIWHYPVSDIFDDSYSFIREKIEAYQVDMRIAPEPWRTARRFFDFDFKKGLFIGSLAGVLRDAPFTTLSDYSVLTFEESDMSTSCNLVWLRNNSNPAIPPFVEAIKDIVTHTDMSQYWGLRV